MKKLFFFLFSTLLISLTSMAQSPDVMNYQAVARNSSGQALANQAIKVRLSITKNAVVLYSETRQAVTNALGLFNVQIGSGGAISTTGSFSSINWQNNPTTHYLKVELDINNGTTFTDMGSQALVSVPYAFNSKTADKATEANEIINIAGRPIDKVTAPTPGSRLMWNGASWTPVKKDTVYNVNTEPIGTSISTGPVWTFLSLNPNNITLSSSDRIVANIASSLGNLSTSSYLVLDIAICYRATNGAVTPFAPDNINQIYILPTTTSGIHNAGFFSASGATTLPAGTYQIGLAVKVANANQIAYPIFNGGVNGTIEVRH